MKLQFHADPGHGWLAVERDLLVRLGIANAITPYSHVRGKTAYLEEDCDLSTFLRACERANIPVEIEERHTDGDSPIRGYAAYRAPRGEGRS